MEQYVFFNHCSLESMCLSSTWLTDLVHVKSHWSILGRLQGSVGTGHNHDTVEHSDLQIVVILFWQQWER